LNMNIFCKCADSVDPKLSKLVHACRNYSFSNLARFLRHSAFQQCISIANGICM